MSDRGAPGRLVSVSTKLAGGTIVLVVLVAAAVYFKLSRYEREGLLQSKELAARQVAQLFADSTTPAVEFGDKTSIEEALTTLGRNDEVAYAAVFSAQKTGEVQALLAQLTRGRSEALDRAPPELELTRTDDRVTIVAPLRSSERELVGAALIAFSLARENAAIAGIQSRTLAISGGVAAGLVLFLMAIARVTIVLPLRKLAAAAGELEAGGAVEIRVDSRDEIGQLASAFRSMAAAVNSREQRISARNRDMRLVLDNVDQGFITVDLEGKMSNERSKIVDRWFGAPPSSMHFPEYLASVNKAVGEWFDFGLTALRENVLPLELSLEQLPKSLKHGEQTLELTYRALSVGDQLDKLLIVITDVTARVERERAERSQREMMNLFQRMLADRAALQQFFEEAAALVDAIEQSDGTNESLVKRQIHTLKGNAALFGLESISAFCHALEDGLAEGIGPLGAGDKAELRALWTRVGTICAGFGKRDAIEVSALEYDAFMEDLRSGAGREVLLATATCWRHEPAATRLRLLEEQIDQLAKRLGKSLRTECAQTVLRLPPSKWAPFWAAFVHAVRNSVDHGVESPQDRLEAGKAECATIKLGIEQRGRNVVVSIADDGPGIDWQRIAASAANRGLPHSTRAELERSLFSDGVSSRGEVTSISGRGVGLGAVREITELLGGHVEIHSEPGRGTSFDFILPESMLYDDPGSHARGGSSARVLAAS
jgi:HPt (histidine-containing phosphotransfer) domain-containing protein/HAMP domain-containing protein